jgi:hypothetical protein
MEHLLSRIRSDDLVAMVFLALAFVAGLVIWLTWQWRLHRRTEMEVSLKQDMLNRGLSAEDIERVLRAPLSGNCTGTNFGAATGGKFNTPSA